MSFVHISGWVQVTEPSGPSGPIDPGFGRPGWSPVDPGFGRPGWSPVDPGWGGGPPVHVGGGPIVRPPHVGGKPPGRPVLPPHIDNGLPPSEPPHIWGGGHWEIIDPGWGKPPILAFFPVDPGWGISETPPPTAGTPLPKPPGGQWVPTDPDFGVGVCPPCGGKPHPPIWAWVPSPPDFSKPVPPAQPK